MGKSNNKHGKTSYGKALNVAETLKGTTKMKIILFPLRLKNS
jgi:hypothetical protein